jgi:hypothetical protein
LAQTHVGQWQTEKTTKNNTIKQTVNIITKDIKEANE